MSPAPAALFPGERTLADLAAARAEGSKRFLRTLVETNSGTANGAGVRAAARLVADELSATGLRVEQVAGESAQGGREHLLAQRGEGAPRVLLIGHVDTVFEPDHPFQGFREEGGRLRGPGVADMKGGLAVLAAALQALFAGRGPARGTVTVVVTTDEEWSSPTSRALVEREARAADVALGLEAGRPSGALVSRRWGYALYRLVCEGKAAHAGVNPEEGVNALEELAHHVIRLRGISRPCDGLTVSVGGEVRVSPPKKNVVPDRAEADVDVRFRGPAEEERSRPAFRSPPPVRPGARVTLEPGLARPPLVVTPASRKLLALVRGVARALGREIEAEETSGGSDASFASALGVPTLDGLGIVGGGYHTAEEWADAESLPFRASLLAVVLSRLLAGSAGKG